MNNYEVKKAILEKIREYKSIIISRHVRPDGDAVGSTLGLARTLRLTFPEKQVFVVNGDYAEYTAFLGNEDAQPDAACYAGSLAIVIDTATPDRISNKSWQSAREVIKIDHHIDVAPYGDIAWVEEHRSSACEMIADFYMTFREELKIEQIQSEIFERVRDNCLRNYGIEVSDVSILRLSLPDTNLESVFDQMRADRQKDIDTIIATA